MPATELQKIILQSKECYKHIEEGTMDFDRDAYDKWVSHPDRPEYEYGKHKFDKDGPFRDVYIKYREIKPPQIYHTGAFVVEFPYTPPGELETKWRKFLCVVDFEDWSAPYDCTARVTFHENTELELHKGTVLKYTKDRDPDCDWKDGDAREYLQDHCSHVYGRPTFIQNEVAPVFEGRPFQNLITYENGWGDCGNINVLVCIDPETGYPLAVCHEASCC